MSKSRVFVLLVVVLALGFLTAEWALAQGQQGQGAQGKPRMMCQDRFTSLDKNTDGQVGRDEFMSVPHRRGNADAVFNGRDVNADGYLTQEEFCGGRGMGKSMGMSKGRIQ